MDRNTIKRLLGRIASGVCAAAMFAAVLVTVPAGEVSADEVSAQENAAKNIVADMGLGWNLGNSLEATGPGTVLTPTTHANDGLDSETAWGNPETTKAMIDAVKAKGFKTVRIPVTWSNHVTDGNYTIDSKWMARVKTVVDYAYGQEMYVILNVHHEKWNKPTNDNIENGKRVMKLIWEQIAEEFKSYGNRLIFEGQNEPRNYDGYNEWYSPESDWMTNVNELNQVFVQTVRETGGNNSSRMLMLPDYAASIDPTIMAGWTKIAGDNNIIVSLHAYSPYEFAMNSGGSYNDTQRASLAATFSAIESTFVSKGYSVVIGEFSASDWGNKNDRVAWAEDFASHINEINSMHSNAAISAVLWDNNSVGSNGSEYHYYLNRTNCKWYSGNYEVVNTLIETITGRDTSDDKDEDITPEYRKDGDIQLVETSAEGQEGAWWEQKDITKSSLLNGHDAADVKSVTFFRENKATFSLFSGDISEQSVEYCTIPLDELGDEFVVGLSGTPGTHHIYWQLNYRTGASYTKAGNDGTQGEYGWCADYDDDGQIQCIYIVYKLHCTEAELKNYDRIVVKTSKGKAILKSETSDIYQTIDFSDNGSDVLTEDGTYLMCWKLTRSKYPTGVTVTAVKGA